MKLVSKQDNALQLDNTLKLMKNFLKKQILNYNFTHHSLGALAINSSQMKLLAADEYHLFRVQTNLHKFSRTRFSQRRSINKSLHISFRKWQGILKQSVIEHIGTQINSNRAKLENNRLRFINRMFKNSVLKSAFDTWRNEAIVFQRMNQ